MTNKKLAVLVAVAVGMVILTTVLYAGREAGPSAFRRGTPLIQGLAPEKVHSIVIRKGSDTTSLVRQGDGFALKERDGYPASVKKINELLVNCLDIRCAEKITDLPANHAALGVADDGAEAVTVSFIGEDGKPLIGFVMGKRAEHGTGPCVRLIGENSVYAAEKYLYIDTRPTDYVVRNLITVKEADIARVDVAVGKDAYTILRDESDKVALLNVAEGKRPKAKEYENTFSALTSLNLTDVARQGKPDLKWDATYTCRLKSGLVYTVKLAERDRKHYVRLSAEGPPVESVRITKTESEENLKKKEAVLLAVETARKFTPRHAPWVYEISSWSAEKMRKPLGELVEDIPADKVPEEIAARHILIGHKGAKRSKATRTRDDASTLSEEVLRKALAKDADFAALAGEYSDGPTKSKGGDLGTFKKGAMDPAFEEAAFKLKVGEVSDVVETPFGFHIIKRTK